MKVKLRKKRNWSKWEHIRFVEDFRSGIKVYELLRRRCVYTGEIQWKRVFVKSCVHNLVGNLNVQFKENKEITLD